jgi:hypothetical protein
MDKVIAAMEEEVKTAQWNVDYHERELKKFTEKRDSFATGLMIIMAQQIPVAI